MASKSKSAGSAPLPFEQSMKELEKIVEALESGTLSLEDSLQRFEQGIQLTRGCQKALQEAEQKVKILLEKNGKEILEDYEEEEDE